MYGCTDDTACNFNPNANIFDESCQYIEENFDCDGNFSNITETDSSGNLIGEIDENDWCEFEFDNNETDAGFGLNPSYPNPVSPGDWGPFENSYQICYQFSTPHDPTWSSLNNVNINIVNTEGEIIHTYSDNYANGQVGICAYISIELINDSIYRMVMESGDFECHGDIQFNQ